MDRDAALPASLARLSRPQDHRHCRGRHSRPLPRLECGMTRERLYLFDTTLRDGQQTPGIDFSLEDKLIVMGMLDSLGLDYIEGGYPGANPTDSQLFAEPRNIRATFTAF